MITGPTASGKTQLALDLAARYPSEIISADAFQIYRGLDIGTAKATATEREQVRHHLIDICDVTEAYSVAEFVRMANPIITAISERGKVPIVIGGTGFYIKALLGEQPLTNLPVGPLAEQLMARYDLSAACQRLQELAPTVWAQTDCANARRVYHALALAEAPAGLAVLNQPAAITDALILTVDHPRNQLYDRINQRVVAMVATGLLAEARWLWELGSRVPQAGQAIGYKEFYPYFAGEMSLDLATAQLQQNSRRYAKRQLTYLRHQFSGVQWLPGTNPLAAAEPLVADFLTKKTP